MIKIGYIYKITNPNGGIYIGKSLRLKDRISKYRCSSGIESQKILYNSIQKYGWENHIFEVIDEGPAENLSNLEIFNIEKYNSYRHINEKGMNLTKGGDGGTGRIDSPEVRKKRADSIKGRKHTESAKILMSLAKKGKTSNRKGIPCSEETKQRVSDANKGRIPTDETINKRNNTRLNKLIEEHGAILKIDKITGEIIKEWFLLPKDINKHFGVLDSNIRKCLKKTKLYALNFNWKYKYE